MATSMKNLEHPKSVAFHNLGCKVNSYELDVMMQMLREKGYRIVPFDAVADIYIVNTCTVTNIADRKSRQMLHRAKQKNPDAIVVAVGCYVQTDKEGVQQDDSIDLAIGNNRKKDIAEILEDFLAKRQVDDAAIPDINAMDCEYEEMTLKQTAEHTRAYIKIQDGCNQFCTYCIIPYARGRVRSRREEDILREIEGLVASGYQEVVLTGIHISSYGIDFAGKKSYQGESYLIDLVEHIHAAVDGLKRIRLGSLEPRIITEETARRLAALPKLCPHFHLSLKRMNRHYTTGEYLQGVRYLRQFFKRVAITTDVIVGFPGETREEFEESKAFLERVGFFEMHIFKYSRREGTAADKMPDQLTDAEKSARSDELFELEFEQSRAFRSDYIGKWAEVLWEEKRVIDKVPYFIGHTADYVRVAVPEWDKDIRNTLTRVYVRGFLTDELMLAKHDR